MKGTADEGPAAELEKISIKYSNVSQLVWRFRNRTAALNYVTRSLTLHAECVKIRGRPMLRWNAWTKNWDFIDLEEEFFLGVSKTRDA